MVDLDRMAQDDRCLKGWMNPKGIPHIVPIEDEHKDNHHPDVAKKIKSLVRTKESISAAQRLGMARFGLFYSGRYVHFNQKNADSRKAAIKALRYMFDDGNDILIDEVSGWRGMSDGKSTRHRSLGAAIRYIKSLESA